MVLHPQAKPFMLCYFTINIDVMFFTEPEQHAADQYTDFIGTLPTTQVTHIVHSSILISK